MSDARYLKSTAVNSTTVNSTAVVQKYKIKKFQIVFGLQYSRLYMKY